MQQFVSSVVKLIFSRPARALLLARMACWVVLLSLAVKISTLPRALSFVSASTRSRLPGRDNSEDLAAAIDALLSLKVFVFKPVCWKRAAILHRFLSLQGIATTINFGLRKGPDDTLDGHAWLEANGAPILETESPNYTVTYVFPSQSPFEMELGQLAKTSV
ncbi:MAG TPA: lasso peptide biosynthesis B2 protein [Pyrinomonadaceae bacterium]|nr:lasso peptide biosynthesis B2 protein [Pyrinomonadaceae bacterium]